MRALKKLVLTFACISMTVQSTFAAVIIDGSMVKSLNQNKSLTDMAFNLMKLFPSEEDHKAITLDLVKLESVANKWLWRYELKGNSLALRVNGKIQASMQFDQQSSDVIVVNGRRVGIAKGKKYSVFKKEMENVLSAKALNLDALFFREAQALGLLAALGIYGLGAAGGYSVASYQCHNSRRCHHRTCRTYGEQGPEPQPAYHRVQQPQQPRVVRVQRPRQCTQQGHRYDRVWRFSTRQVWRMAQNFRGQACDHRPNPCFRNVDECVSWKTGKPRNSFGIRMSRSTAQMVCQNVADQIAACVGGSPSYQPPVYQQPQTPYQPPSDVDTPGNPYHLLPEGVAK
jgi:hypothetical protein